MKTKFIASIFLAASMSLALLGCGEDSTNEVDNAGSVSTIEESASDEEESGISPGDYDDALEFLEAYTEGIEENSSSMVDEIAHAAEKEANYSGAKLKDEALEYISENYPDYFTNNNVMETTMFYGYYLEYVYADEGSDNTYANLGMDTYQVVKYVYRGTETVDDDNVQANLEQIAEALTALGYLDE